MDNFSYVLSTFLDLECVALLSMEGQKALRFHCVPKMNECLTGLE